MALRPREKTETAPLIAAGLPDAEVRAWAETQPGEVRALVADVEKFCNFWRLSDALRARLPRKPARKPQERAAADAIDAAARAVRTQFLTAYVDDIYDKLTVHRLHFRPIAELAAAAALAVPGLVPSPEALAADAALPLRDKEGVEIDQGLFLAAVLGSQRSGRHLCHAMLLPRPEALELLPRHARDDVIDLGPASVERHGRASIVTMKNPRHLNAEDNTTLGALATCVDLALLDEATGVAVLRGAPVDHPKYAGRRVFGAGINLTHLYHGRIPFLWYLERDLGYLNKIYRGLARPDALPDDVRGQTIEKPWIAAVDAFAIGGHCQALLVMDFVLAARDAYLTLPARKEGIIPGWPISVCRVSPATAGAPGDPCTSGASIATAPEGRLICDEVAEPSAMDTAIAEVIARLTGSES